MTSILGTGARRQKVLRYARSHPPTQWQGGPAFEHGATGCSATDIQFVLGLNGHKVTLSEIADVAGYPDAVQKKFHIGLWDHQVVTVLAHWKVRYEFTTDLSFTDLMRICVRKGPVFFACTYGSWPQRRGAVYGKKRADGEPNGYAQSDGEGGKDQLSGFETGRHMGLLLSKRHRKGRPWRTTKVYLWDPNHGSKMRPHRPDYDVITPHQWDVLYRSARQSSNNHLPMALVPLDAL